MSKEDFMKLSCCEELAAQVIGLEVLKYLKDAEILKGLELKTESKALQILEEIRHILDDNSLDDAECFKRIEAIVKVMEANGIQTTRHDW